MARRAIVQSPQPLTAVCGWRAPDLHVSGTSDTYSPWWRSRESGVPVSESVDKGRKEPVRRFYASTRRVVDQEVGCLPLIFTRSYSYGTRRRHESPFPPFGLQGVGYWSSFIPQLRRGSQLVSPQIRHAQACWMTTQSIANEAFDCSSQNVGPISHPSVSRNGQDSGNLHRRPARTTRRDRRSCLISRSPRH